MPPRCAAASRGGLPPGVCAPRGGVFAAPVGVSALRGTMAVATRRALNVVVWLQPFRESIGGASSQEAAQVQGNGTRQPHTTVLLWGDGEPTDALGSHDGVSDAPSCAQYHGVCAEPLMLAVGNAHVADG